MADAPRMPALYFGHGSPMNAIEDTRFSREWRAIGESLPKPRAIVVISAHWALDHLAATASDRPRTIHDFTGFPKALYDVRYPAPGNPALAQEVARLLAPLPVTMDSRWGFDHGSWSVLRHLYPSADVPVIELSVDVAESPRFQFDVGTKLAPLRERGILVMGTGNVVHNLMHVHFGASVAFDWAERFDGFVRDCVERGDAESLVAYRSHPDAALAAPDYEHFAPVLSIAGLRMDGDRASFFGEGIEAGSISMRGFRLASAA